MKLKPYSSDQGDHGTCGSDEALVNILQKSISYARGRIIFCRPNFEKNINFYEKLY